MRKFFLTLPLAILFNVCYALEPLREIQLEENGNETIYIIKNENKEKEKYQDSRFGYVYIAGEIKKNGSLEWKDNMTITDAIISSEYFTPLRANQKEVIVKRGGRNVYVINIKDIFDKTSPDQNFLLKRGDTIIVKRNIPAIISDKIRILFLPIIDIFGNLTSAIIQASSSK